MFASDVQPFSPDGWQMFFTDDFNRSYAPEWQFGEHLIRQFYDHSALFFYDPALWAVPPAPDLFDLRIQLRANVSLGDLRMRWRESGSGFYELILTPSGLLELQRSGTSVTSANMQIPSDWVLLTMTMVGDTLSVDLDETPYLLYSDPELLPSGRVSFSGALSEMDDFTLWVPPEMVVPPTNTAPFPLTPADCTTASLPLNGETMLIFSAIPPGAQVNAIFVMNPDGSGRQPLLACPVGLAGPRISPDGTQIVFAAGGLFSTYPDLYVLRVDGGVYADGSIIRQITFDSAAERAPAWSPDSTKIVFASNRSNPGIYVLDIASLAVAPLNYIEPYGQLGHVLPHHLDWSPDGSRILFEKIDGSPIDANIASLDYPSATVSTFINDPAPYRWEEMARWSGDGSSIVFGWSQGSIHGISQYVPASGVETLWRTNPSGYSSFDWSPDSSQIVYSAYPEANLFVGPAYASSGDVQISFANTDFHVDWGIRPPCSPGGSGQGGGAGGMQLSAICLPVTPTSTPTSTPSPTGTCTVILNNTLPGYNDPLAVEAATPGTETAILVSGSSILVTARWNVFPNIVLGSYPSFPLNQFWFNSGEGNVTLPNGEDCNDLPLSSGGSFAVHIVSDNTGTREWTVSEGEEIIHALSEIGAAFGTITHVPDSSAVGAFNRVFTSIPAQYPQYIMLVRANSTADSPLRPANQSNAVNDPNIPDVTVEFYLGSELHQGFYLDVQLGNCKSFQAQVAVVEINSVNRSVEMPYAIVCNGELLNSTLNTSEPPSSVPGEASQHTVAHEFGHIFDYIAGGAFTNEVSTTLSLGSCRSQEFAGANYLVMYTGSDGIFRRGARGWGSAPPFSRFIQSPESSIYLEASADLFLNWIFRTNDGGESSIDGISRSAALPPIEGCTDVDLQPATPPQIEFWDGFWNRVPSDNQPIAMSPYDWGMPGEIRFKLAREVIQSIFDQAEHSGW